jgi:hypothetical protein
MADSEARFIFLVMFCGGGGPYTIADIVGAYDRVNRSIPSRIEMKTALNLLLAMDLIQKKNETFLVPKRQLPVPWSMSVQGAPLRTEFRSVNPYLREKESKDE